MIYQRVKGMLDYIGEAAERFRHVEKCFTEEVKKQIPRDHHADH